MCGSRMFYSFISLCHLSVCVCVSEMSARRVKGGERGGKSLVLDGGCTFFAGGDFFPVLTSGTHAQTDFQFVP